MRSNLFRRFVVNIALVILIASSLSACKGKNPNPIAPGPTSGTVVFIYTPTEPCKSANIPTSLRCHRIAMPVTFRIESSKPGVYLKTNVAGAPLYEADGKTLRLDGSVELRVDVTSSSNAGRLIISAYDAFTCEAGVSFCKIEPIGKGFTANGVRLNDGPSSTSFEYYPPDEIRK